MTRSEKSRVKDAEEILLKYWPQISYRVKNSIGHLTPDWEDVGSEILVNVIEALRNKKFREESSLGTFIYAVTTHKIIDFIRRKKKTVPEFPAPSQDFDPYLHVEKEERVRLITQCLKKMKPKFADILYLHYYLDLPQAEIARIYGISTGRMSSLIQEARNTLKDLMQNLQPGEM